MKKIFYVILLCLSCLSLKSTAQEIDFKVGVNTNDVLIGDEIKLTVSVTYPTNKYAIVFPNINESFVAPFTIVRQQAIDTTETAQNTTCTQVTTIALYDSGYVLIPKIYLNGFNTESAKALDIYSDSILIRVNNVAVNYSGDIKEIFEPKLKKNWIKIIAISLGILLLIGGLIFAIVYLIKETNKKNLNKKIAVFPHTQKILHQIEHLPLNTLENQKIYFTQLSYALKWYLQQRFKIGLLEKTSAECLELFSIQKEITTIKSIASNMFGMADAVKFANSMQVEADCKLAWKNIYNAIQKLEEDYQAALISKNKELKKNV